MVARSLRSLALLTLVAGDQAFAQEPARPGLAGVVFDSIRGIPLRGAIVQAVLVDVPPRTFAAITDDSGRYRIAGLPRGKYAVGFQHDAVVALGLDATITAAELLGDKPVALDLTLAPGRSTHFAMCRNGGDDAHQGILAGYVLDAADSRPLRSVEIVAEWSEIADSRGKLALTQRRVVADVADNGTYRLCDMPTDGPVSLSVSSDGFVPISIEATPPNGGIARRDLHLVHVGDLRGKAAIRLRVVDTSGAPLAAGHVAIAALSRFISLQEGRASVDGIPAGTWAVELRALGYEPQQMLLHAVADSAPVETITMMKRIVTLEAMRVVAKLNRRDSAALAGIEERMRVAMGTLITATNASLLSALTAADALRVARGFTFKRGTGLRRERSAEAVQEHSNGYGARDGSESPGRLSRRRAISRRTGRDQ